MSAQQYPVELEYQKNPDIKPEDIAKLRRWLMTQPHLPQEYISDLILFLTYHSCENSLEVSKQVLDLHYTLKTSYTTLFLDRKWDSRVKAALNTVLATLLPTQSVSGYRVLYLRLLDPDPRKFNLCEVARAAIMLFDIYQYEEGTWPGLVLVLDMDQAVIGHMAKIDINLLKNLGYFVQQCLLVKLKEIHFINAPHFVDKLMTLLKLFISKRLIDMIRIHQVGSDTLYDYIPKKAFPKEEGGDYKDHGVLRDETLRKLQNNKEFFIEDNLRRVNEDLRPGGRSEMADTASVQGNFKSLAID